MGAENAGVENAGEDKVWKAVRIKYSVDSAWQIALVKTYDLNTLSQDMQSADKLNK